MKQSEGPERPLEVDGMLNALARHADAFDEAWQQEASINDPLRQESEIRRLLAQYAQLADDYSLDGWAALFSDDGRFSMSEKVVQGHANLRAWLAQVQAAVGRTRHLMMNAVINLESSDRASGSVDMLMLTTVDEKWVIRAAPRYRDRYVRTAAGWRFAERAIESR